jgi:hypothetical protein
MQDLQVNGSPQSQRTPLVQEHAAAIAADLLQTPDAMLSTELHALAVQRAFTRSPILQASCKSA